MADVERPAVGDGRGGPVSENRVIRLAMAVAVCAVAALAAVVSYSHIYGLGRAHGQDSTAARLLPLSVDGLILAALLVLLHQARNGRDVPRLARLMLWLGIGATIGANLAYGAGYGLLGALILAWPAVAFIGAGEIALQQVRRARVPPTAIMGLAVLAGAGRRGAGGPRRVRGAGRGRAAVEPAGRGRAVRPVPAPGEPARRPDHRVRQWLPARKRGGMSMNAYDELPWYDRRLAVGRGCPQDASDLRRARPTASGPHH
jgi:Protein of unknown function (DUF2637)